MGLQKQGAFLVTLRLLISLITTSEVAAMQAQGKHCDSSPCSLSIRRKQEFTEEWQGQWVTAVQEQGSRLGSAGDSSG